MKRSNLLVLANLVVLALPLTAHAWPSGESAKEAARLKINPPPTWVAHYLPDDRYKVAGGVWKVVTTDLDTYYHRPNCPNMLRQSADMVVGFPSPKEAEEAGYRPDPTCGAAAMTSSIGPGGFITATEISPGFFRLSDGVSTIRLSAGWSHKQGGGGSQAGQKFSQDIFASTKGEQLMVLTMPLPAQYAREIKRELNAAGWKKYVGQTAANRKTARDAIRRGGIIGSSEGVNMVNTLTDLEGRWKVTDWKAGLAKGVKIVVSGQSASNQMKSLYLGIVGDKYVWVIDGSGSKSGSEKMVQTLQVGS